MAGRRAQAGTAHALDSAKTFQGAFTSTKDPPFLDYRLGVWDRLIAKHNADLACAPRNPIRITLEDGQEKKGTSFVTTPLDIALEISKKLAGDVVCAKLTYEDQIASLSQCVAADDEESEAEDGCCTQDTSVLWDLTRPIEGNCKLQLLKFDSPEGKDVFWHSSAHILGQVLERTYGAHLTIGPALKEGFYYDCFVGDKNLSQDNFDEIASAYNSIAKEQQPFERCVLSKEDALELFKNNPFKVQLITNKVPDGSKTSVYRCGPLIDLCRGPHLPNTSIVKSFTVTKNSSAYWLGKATNDSLQRIYGISFPSDKQLKAYQHKVEEAKKRDHREIGKKQELFFFHAGVSPGSCFWQPAGSRIYNKLIDFMKQEYRIRGFDEVITPNIYSSQLFIQSGHYQNYKDCMYGFDVEGQEWFLKPMNCPGHCMVFDHRVRSYKELPLRMSSFGVLHRNELSGTLSGLTRVRRFQQDDAHIFVRPDQIKKEIMDALDFLSFVYDVFGFKYTMALSTRPKKALGSRELWDEAEKSLKEALDEHCDKHGREWLLNAGDGAFYGPKIDIRLEDALEREHQCGTIQLDFQLPIRFNLQYRTEHHDGKEEEVVADKEDTANVERNEQGEIIWREGKLRPGMERPVIIHRAILGSIERFTAILTEHFAGKYPYWIAPRQVMVVPVSEKYNEYAEYVSEQLHGYGIYSDADTSHDTMNKKIRNAQFGDKPYFYVAVVGEKEVDSLSVALRKRDEVKPTTIGILDLVTRLEKENMPNSQVLNTLKPYKGRMPGRAEGEGNVVLKQVVETNVAEPEAPSLESFLEIHPYISGYAPSKRDAELFHQFSDEPPSTPNVLRWFNHIASFAESVRHDWK